MFAFDFLRHYRWPPYFGHHTNSPCSWVAQRNASPLQATTEQLKGLPPTLIQTAEFDVLRDEAEAYGRKLDAAGVHVKSVRYNGMIHDFGLSNMFSHLPAPRSAIAQASQELKANLGK